VSIKQKRPMILTCFLFLVAGTFLFSLTAAFAFRIEIPEDIAKLPQAEQDKYVNDILKEAKAEQERLGIERHEERLKDQEALSNELAQRAEERRQLILEAREEREREEAETERRTKSVFFISMVIVISAVGYFIYRKKKESTFEDSEGLAGGGPKSVKKPPMRIKPLDGGKS